MSDAGVVVVHALSLWGWGTWELGWSCPPSPRGLASRLDRVGCAGVRLGCGAARLPVRPHQRPYTAVSMCALRCDAVAAAVRAHGRRGGVWGGGCSVDAAGHAPVAKAASRPH